MRLPFWATIFTLLGLIILIGLGSWQIKRLQWKNNIIEQLDAAYASAGESAPLDFKQLEPLTFGSIEGIFKPEKSVLIGPTTKKGQVGRDVITPLETKDRTLLVNLGWTDETDIKNLPIFSAQNKRVELSGLIMAPERNAFTSGNSPQNDIWFYIDPAQIADAKSLKNILPVYLIAESASYKFDAAFPNNDRFYPRNKHAQYAFFWFALAGGLLLIYTLRFLRKP